MPGRTLDRTAPEADDGPRMLSFWRPWSAFVFADIALPKGTENRGSFPWTWRGTLYVHSAQRWDRVGETAAQVLGLPYTRTSTPTGYIGLVTLTDVHHADDDACRCHPLWAEPDAYHLVLEDPRPFKEA